MSGSYDLERFVSAQIAVYNQVLDELRKGRKASHWMWFIFPQIQGLGSSPAAIKFGIESAAEARAYLDHRVLGARLIECSLLVLNTQNSSVEEIFGYPDNLKFHSSMTLFGSVARPDNNPDEGVFERNLESYFAGEKDSETFKRLK